MTDRDRVLLAMNLGGTMGSDKYQKASAREIANGRNGAPTPEGTEPNAKERPSHYCAGEYECIDILRAIATPPEFQAHCRLTAMKYLWRVGGKGPAISDVRKAEDYLRWMRESLEAE